MSKKNIISLFFALGIGFLVLGYELNKINSKDLAQEISQMHLGWLLIAFLCMIFHWCIEAKILQRLLKRENANFSFKNAVRVPIIEHLFNAITPFSTGGQPAQLITLVKSGIDPGVSGSVCLMKFVVYQLMIVINFIGCLIFGFNLIANDFKKLSYLVLLGFLINVIVVIALLMLMFCYPLTNTLVKGILKLIKMLMSKEKGDRLEKVVFNKMENFYAESQYMKSEKKMMRDTFLLTFLQLICYYIVPYFILLSLGIKNSNIFQIVVFHAFIILIISLFPIPGGSGGAEYSFTLLFGGLTLSASKIVVAVVLWRIVTHYFGIFLGIVALFIPPDVDYNGAENNNEIIEV